MGDDVAALLPTLAAENAELREQLAPAQGILMETAIDAGQLHARIEVVQAERDAWQAEAEWRHTGSMHSGASISPLGYASCEVIG